MTDEALTDDARAKAILAAQRLNLLTRAKNGERLSPAEWDELRRFANDKSGAPAWPDRATLAAELKLTGHQVAGLARRGMPADKSGHIEQLPVLLWLWNNRAELAALSDDSDPEAESRSALRGEQVEKLRLANEARRRKHLEEAQAFVARKFRDLENALYRDLTGKADQVWELCQGPRTTTVPRLVQTLRDLVADTINQAVAP